MTPALFHRYRDKEQQRRREADRVHHHLHMARKYGLSATLTLEEWLATLAHFHWKCAYCQHAPYTVLEHFEPVIAGGGTTRYNCVPACDVCNLAKQGFHPDHIPAEYGMDEGIARVRSYLASLRRQALDQWQKRRGQDVAQMP
jgi:5-methylcytosine-specific restriction endonuclease McrA